jgi:nucleoside-diphosphate-sugar epimerase
MVIPAIRGSEVLLASALKAGPQLKSVVVTSSVVAIINPPSTPDHVYTEAEFASVNLERAIRERDEGIQTPGNVLYGASKTAADRRVWEFRNEHKVRFPLHAALIARQQPCLLGYSERFRLGPPPLNDTS